MSVSAWHRKDREISLLFLLLDAQSDFSSHLVSQRNRFPCVDYEVDPGPQTLEDSCCQSLNSMTQ